MDIKQEPKYMSGGGRIYNRASGEPIPDDEPVFILRARDVHAIRAIQAYHGFVKDSGHQDAVWERWRDFDKFRMGHPDRMREPDTATDNEGGGK